MMASLSKVPTELRKILLDFTLSCLLEKPRDYVEHGVRYFERLRECREKERIISRNKEGSESSNQGVENREEMMASLANRRKSVAAERYVPEDDDSLESIVIPKSDQDRKKLAEDVKEVFILRALERDELNKVMDAMVSKSVEKDEVIIQQGDKDAGHFFVIAEGVFEALVSHNSEEPKVVKTYDNSGSFGELALMYNVPRAATIRAVTEGKLWVLDRETFRRIVLRSAYLKRERYHELIEKVSFLKDLNSYAKLDLADSLIPKYYTDGEIIFNQGDVADGMYFVETGNVCLLLNHPVQGEVIVNELFPGGYLGELALITHNRRALTAVAEGDVKLAFLDKDTFERLLGPCTEVLTKHFMDYEDKMVEAVGSATSVYFQPDATVREIGGNGATEPPGGARAVRAGRGARGREGGESGPRGPCGCRWNAWPSVASLALPYGLRSGVENNSRQSSPSHFQCELSAVIRQYDSEEDRNFPENICKGGFGKFQCYQFLLHVLAGFCAGLHMITLVTVAAVPQHRCMIPSIENETWQIDPANDSWLEKYIPRKEDGSWDSCRLITENGTKKCDSWIYDHTYYSSSRGMEWDFVCDRRWMGAVSKSAYIFGVFIGAVSLGTLADKYGRKTIFCISAVMQLVLGVGVAFINEFYSFMFTSFVYGIFGSAGAYITGFVLSMELVGANYRTACGVAFQAMFAFGMMMVALWGSFITDYTLLQIIYGLHSLLLIPHCWLMTESPRWLWSQGRIAESVDIVCRGVEMNGFEAPDKSFFISRGKATEHRKDQQVQSYGIVDMFKTPRLRIITLNVCLNWFANSLGYYGLSLNTDKLFSPDMNPFLALFIMGLVEVPSYIMTVLILDKTGRRCLTATLMIIGGAACLSTPFIPTATSIGSITAILVVFIGKFCIAGSFAIIYNYSAELFPTVIRNTALGLGSMCARFSATLTPLITLLDSFDKRIPTLVFATVTLIAGITTLFLPETLNKSMPQSLEDGENFGRGDTCFTTGCLGSKMRRDSVPMDAV